ncbi:TPA: flagellar biosynthesis protein FlhB [bacterium]|nr:flagellar biosynthesis protein FlhB [bacterium]
MEILNHQSLLTTCPLTSSVFYFDLQLFASAEEEGRTEQPTGRKVSKAREKGQVAKSAEVTQALVLLFGFVLLCLISPYMLGEIVGFSRYIFGHLHEIKLTPGNVISFLIVILFLFFKVVFPIMFVAAIVAFLGDYIQVGYKWTLEPLKFKFSKLMPNPAKVLKRLWISKMTVWNLLKSGVKVSIIAYLSYQVIRKNYGAILLTMGWDVTASLFFICKLAFEIIIKATIVFLIISIVDYFFMKHEHIEGLKMTKQEVKDEHKMMEGDPLIKGAIKRRQREIARQRMMQEVPKADVVITNPVHIAVALKYDPAYMSAPTVVAKGEDIMAQKIIEVAREHGVPIIENKPLAWALYESAEIGDEIPPELYRAVAEVLSYIYQNKGEGARRAG